MIQNDTIIPSLEKSIPKKYHGRYGITTSSTIKYSKRDAWILRKTIPRISLYQAKSYNEKENIDVPHITADDTQLVPRLPYSINRKKRWEILENLERDLDQIPDGYSPYTVFKGYPHWSRREHPLIKDIPLPDPLAPPNPNREPAPVTTENISEDDFRLVKRKNGWNIKKKRTKGKKVKKNDKSRPNWHENYLKGELNNVYIIDLPPEKKGFPYHHFKDNNTCGCWICDGRKPKNHSFKRRQELLKTIDDNRFFDSR